MPLHALPRNTLQGYTPKDLISISAAPVHSIIAVTGQTDRFVVSAIVKQFVRVAQGIQKPVIHIGNGMIVRDFVDVHDVVEAYYLLLTKGKKGEVYNICSGKGIAIQDIVTILSEILSIPVDTLQEKSQIRPD